MEYCIYKLYNNDELLYIGKTTEFEKRLYYHMDSQTWSNQLTHVEIAECKNRIDMDIYEKYYINKLKPKYNKAIVYNESTTFEIEELNFERNDAKVFIRYDKYLKYTVLANNDKRKSNNEKTIAFKLNEKLFNEFKKIISENGLNSSAVLRSAVEKFVEENK